jgi:putative FmdB family regulatory protein
VPAYQYKCADCNEITEEVRGITEDIPDLFCKICNLKLKRIYSNIGVTFNGSGFYKTDNRKG